MLWVKTNWPKLLHILNSLENLWEISRNLIKTSSQPCDSAFIQDFSILIFFGSTYKWKKVSLLLHLYISKTTYTTSTLSRNDVAYKVKKEKKKNYSLFYYHKCLHISKTTQEFICNNKK